MTHLFTYGSLMCEDILQEVAGCRPVHESGTLHGYCRRRVKGEVYPGLRQQGGGSVAGVVYYDVPASAWRRLDLFEGEMYGRKPVPVELENGTVLTAETYVVNSDYLTRLEEADWDFPEFLRHGKQKFQSGYNGYQTLK